MDHMDRRQALRREMRRRRRALSPQEQNRAALQLSRLLVRQPLFVRSRNIALYLANDGEICPRFVLQKALAMGKRCYLPVLQPGARNRLWFARYQQGTPLFNNRFGIPEPLPALSTLCRAPQLDLVLMPLVAFDRRGGRLGMGGGFYDRTFAFKQKVNAHKPYLLGLAHQCQEVPALDLAHWDIPLHGIATDKGLVVNNRAGNQRDFTVRDQL